jgi:iron complex outermembrane receptor protein
VPFAPEITVTAGIQYDVQVGRWTITPRLQASYLDEQLSTPFPYVATIVPSRTIADLRLTARPSEKLRLEAFATNLLDETYIAAQVQDASSASGGIIYGPPRQVGVRVKFDF